jgi:hypothetical protein
VVREFGFPRVDEHFFRLAEERGLSKQKIVALLHSPTATPQEIIRELHERGLIPKDVPDFDVRGRRRVFGEFLYELVDALGEDAPELFKPVTVFSPIPAAKVTAGGRDYYLHGISHGVSKAQFREEVHGLAETLKKQEAVLYLEEGIKGHYGLDYGEETVIYHYMRHQFRDVYPDVVDFITDGMRTSIVELSLYNVGVEIFGGEPLESWFANELLIKEFRENQEGEAIEDLKDLQRRLRHHLLPPFLRIRMTRWVNDADPDFRVILPPSRMAQTYFVTEGLTLYSAMLAHVLLAHPPAHPVRPGLAGLVDRAAAWTRGREKIHVLSGAMHQHDLLVFLQHPEILRAEFRALHPPRLYPGDLVRAPANGRWKEKYDPVLARLVEQVGRPADALPVAEAFVRSLSLEEAAGWFDYAKRRRYFYRDVKDRAESWLLAALAMASEERYEKLKVSTAFSDFQAGRAKADELVAYFQIYLRKYASHLAHGTRALKKRFADRREERAEAVRALLPFLMDETPLGLIASESFLAVDRWHPGQNRLKHIQNAAEIWALLVADDREGFRRHPLANRAVLERWDDLRRSLLDVSPKDLFDLTVLIFAHDYERLVGVVGGREAEDKYGEAMLADLLGALGYDKGDVGKMKLAGAHWTLWRLLHPEHATADLMQKARRVLGETVSAVPPGRERETLLARLKAIALVDALASGDRIWDQDSLDRLLRFRGDISSLERGSSLGTEEALWAEIEGVLGVPALRKLGPAYLIAFTDKLFGLAHQISSGPEPKTWHLITDRYKSERAAQAGLSAEEFGRLGKALFSEETEDWRRLRARPGFEDAAASFYARFFFERFYERHETMLAQRGESPVADKVSASSQAGSLILPMLDNALLTKRQMSFLQEKNGGRRGHFDIGTGVSGLHTMTYWPAGEPLILVDGDPFVVKVLSAYRDLMNQVHPKQIEIVQEMISSANIAGLLDRTRPGTISGTAVLHYIPEIERYELVGGIAEWASRNRASVFLSGPTSRIYGPIDWRSVARLFHRENMRVSGQDENWGWYVAALPPDYRMNGSSLGSNRDAVIDVVREVADGVVDIDLAAGAARLLMGLISEEAATFLRRPGGKFTPGEIAQFLAAFRSLVKSEAQDYGLEIDYRRDSLPSREELEPMILSAVSHPGLFVRVIYTGPERGRIARLNKAIQRGEKDTLGKPLGKRFKIVAITESEAADYLRQLPVEIYNEILARRGTRPKNLTEFAKHVVYLGPEEWLRDVLRPGSNGIVTDGMEALPFPRSRAALLRFKSAVLALKTLENLPSEDRPLYQTRGGGVLAFTPLAATLDQWHATWKSYVEKVLTAA